MITDDREATAEMAPAGDRSGLPAEHRQDVELTVEDVLRSPYLAFGTFWRQIADQIRGASTHDDVVRRCVPTQLDAFAPVLALLKGEWAFPDIERTQVRCPTVASNLCGSFDENDLARQERAGSRPLNWQLMIRVRFHWDNVYATVASLQVAGGGTGKPVV